MENRVHLGGTVKRAAESGSGVLDFALEVINEKGRRDIFDCRTTAQAEAFGSLEGFVNEGEELEIMGHLEKRTFTEQQRVAGVMVEVRHTATIVFVDIVIKQEE